MKKTQWLFTALCFGILFTTSNTVSAQEQGTVLEEETSEEVQLQSPTREVVVKASDKRSYNLTNSSWSDYYDTTYKSLWVTRGYENLGRSETTKWEGLFYRIHTYTYHHRVY